MVNALPQQSIKGYIHKPRDQRDRPTHGPPHQLQQIVVAAQGLHHSPYLISVQVNTLKPLAMVWQPEPLPFSSNSLPESPLPSKDEIRACTNILFERVYKVAAINDEIVVKFGRGVKEYEGQVLIFLERHVPTIPAPRLYAMYKDTETHETFLVMQRIPGKQLDAIWPSLAEDEKDDITDKLCQIFNTLR